MTETAADQGLFIVRKPVFDRDQNVLSHEVDVGTASPGLGVNADVVNHCLLDEGLHLTGGPEGGGQIIVTLTPAMLADRTLLDMPADRTTLVLSQDITGTAGVLEQMDEFRDAGFVFGVTVGLRKPVSSTLVEAADVVRVRLDGLNPKEIMALVREVKPMGLPMLASGVDEWQTYEGTKALGFTQFQGKFFSQPKLEKGKKLSESSLSKIQLMQELLRPGCDLNELAAIISRDTVLSYRLLKFINSASFSLMQKISSIQQAVAFLGLNQLKQWASFMVVSDMDDSPKGEELTYSGLLRARFLEVCAGLSNCLPGHVDAMFITGLFSRLDAMLGMPMRQVIEGMPLDEEVADALLGKEGTLRTWLDMVDAVEAGEWDVVQQLVGNVDLKPEQVATEYMRAATWAGVRCNDQQSIS